MATPYQRKLFRHIRGRIELISRKARLGKVGDSKTYIPVTGCYAICLSRIPNTPYYYYTIIDQKRGIIYSRKGPIQTLHNAVSTAVISCYCLRYPDMAIPIMFFGIKTGRVQTGMEVCHVQDAV